MADSYIFHIVHSLRFPLLAPLKPTFGIGTNDPRFGYSSQPCTVNWPCGAPDQQFWWKQHSWGAHLVLHWVWQLWFNVFSVTIRVSTQTSLFHSFLLRPQLDVVLLDGMLTLAWIQRILIHHTDLLFWSQMQQRDVHQQVVLFWTLICHNVVCIAVFKAKMCYYSAN